MATGDLPLSGLTTRGTPDRTADQIYVVNGSTQYRSTINNELGITGAPVGTTDSQTLTNKTFTGPTITSPVLSGTVTGTYTLGGTPTFPASVVTLTGSQTLTNKILTSPTISSPTITNASITADAISGFTTANSGTIYGVAVTSGVISSNNVVPNNSLSNTGSFGSSWAWAAYSPSWLGDTTNPAIGNGTLTGSFQQIGKTTTLQITLTFGSTTTYGSGSWSFSLPNTSTSKRFIGSAWGLRTGTQFNVGAVTNATALGVLETTKFRAFTQAGGAGWASTVPSTWASGDVLGFSLTYESA